MKNDQTRYRFRGASPPAAGCRRSLLTPELTPRAEEGLVDGVAELWLYDPIDSWGGDWGVSAKEFTVALAELPDSVQTIRLYINSPGGEIWDALAIVNQLIRHPARTVAVVDGIAASAASMIAAACDELRMGVGAQLMIHDAWNIAIGDEAAMLAAAARLSRDSDTIAAIYAAKAGGTIEGWRELMRAETWYDPAEAVAAGLADSLADDVDKDATKARAQAHDLTHCRYAGRQQAPAPQALQRATPSRKDPIMEPLAAIRQHLALGPDADLDTILAAINTDAGPALSYELSTPMPGTMVVDASAFEQLQADAAAGRAAVERETAARRDQAIDQALRAGKITTASRQQWRDAMDANEDSTIALLATMPTIVPLDAHVAQGDPTDVPEDATYNRLFPKEPQHV